MNTALKLKYNLFTDDRLDTLEQEARSIIEEAYRAEACMSLSGGIDSSIMFHIMQKFNIEIEDVFFNNAVEPIENQKMLKKYTKYFKNIHKAKTKSYKSIVEEIGFPIKNKNFSEMCYRLRNVKLNKNNILDKFRLVTGVNIFNLGKGVKVNGDYAIDLKYWYLASNYPIQSNCCKILKKDPSSKVGSPMIIGIMADDSPARRRAINSAYHGKFFPLKSWTKQDVFMYAKRENIDYSKAYHDKKINDNIKIIGSVNTGCIGCHFGQNQNHYIEINGERVSVKKFDKLKLINPKAHKHYMEMKCEGYTFEEVIKVFEDSANGKYMSESIKIRNKMIFDILEMLPSIRHKKTGEKVPREAYELIKSFIMEEVA